MLNRLFPVLARRLGGLCASALLALALSLSAGVSAVKAEATGERLGGAPRLAEDKKEKSAIGKTQPAWWRQATGRRTFRRSGKVEVT